MRSTIWKFLFLALVPFPLPGQEAVADEPNSRHQMRVGAILPLTGEMSYVGKEMQRGMELALEDFAEAQIELFIEDDGVANITAAVTAAQKLVHRDRVVLLLNSVVNTLPAVAPIAGRQGVPAIVLWDDNQKILDMGEHVYTIGFSTEGAGSDMAEFAWRELGTHQTAIISAHDEWSKIISQAFRNRFEQSGGEVVTAKEYDPAETDFRATLASIKQKGIGAIYAPLFPGPLVSLVKQARSLGYDGFILTGDALGESELRALGKSGEGIYTTQLWLRSDTFQQRYQRKFGKSSSPTHLAFAALGYDAIRLAALVYERLESQSKRISAENVDLELPLLSFKGHSGHTVLSRTLREPKRISLLKAKNGKLFPTDFQESGMRARLEKVPSKINRKRDR